MREDLLEQQFFELLMQYRLLADFRRRIAEAYLAGSPNPDQDAMPTRRQTLESEQERVKFQHQHGLISDADLLREVRRIRAAIDLLPIALTDEAPVARSIEAAETLEALVGYWAEAARLERIEFVHHFVLPEALFYDLPRQRIAVIQPRPAFLRPLELALADWVEEDGVLSAPLRSR